MFGIKMKPEQMLGIAKGMGIDINAIFSELEKAILEEAQKIRQETGKRVFLVAEAINNDQNIQVTIYTEGEKEGDLDPYRSFHFSQLLDLFQNTEKIILNEPHTPQQAIGTAADNELSGNGATGASGDGPEPAAVWNAKQAGIS